MISIVISKNGIPIRLTEERWMHISGEHMELAGMQFEVIETVANPVRILAGNAGELLALREIEQGKWLIVVYSEENNDGFIITAFLTRRTRSLEKRIQVWP